MDRALGTELIRPIKKDKLSRWWIAFHLWGGLCLKAFMDISGLLKVVLGPPSAGDQASAAGSAGVVGFLTVAVVAIGYFLSRTIVKAIDATSFPKKAKTTAKVILPFAYFAGAVFLAMVMGPLIASPATPPKAASSPVSESSEVKPVLVYTTVQSTDGVTEADLDQAGLTNLQNWVVETILQKSRSKFAEMGYDPKDFKPKIVAKSVYVIAGRKKLAVIKVDIDSSMRSVTIMGIKGNELHRIACIRGSNHDIPLWSGECGNKIKEVFGVSVGP
jgi:hypothetical protein